MEKEVLLEARNVIDDIYKNGLDEKYIKELYHLLGNDSIPLRFKNSGINTAAFNPKFMHILINTQKLNKWLNDMVCEILNHFNINDIELLKPYLIVYALSHEIEHSNQKLIADEKKQPNYDYEIDVYNDIFNVIYMKQYILPRPMSLTRDIIRFINYKTNEYNLILERNASIEGYNIASCIANLSNDKEMLDYLISVRNVFMLQGYVDGKEGCLKYTYKTLGMMRKYNNLVFPNNMSLHEKARKGLELNDVERKKVILSLKQTTHFK